MEKIDSKGKLYCSDFMEDLPDNVILNKVVTGCGMTTLALTNPVKYVICVPFKNLVKSKLAYGASHGLNLLGVFGKSDGGCTDAQLLAYTGNKILVTWDSLARVVNLLGTSIGEWKILIDESHKLIDSGAFRPQAINSVLDNYKKFKSYVFGTATPVKDIYQHPSLSNIDKVSITWDNLQPVNIHLTKIDSKLNDRVALLAIGFLKGERQGNAHIFLNSVSVIAKIIKVIKKNKLPQSSIRIVCSDTERNAAVTSHILQEALPISCITSPVVKVNFYTSTAFEGCDIYDEEGLTYVVVDGSLNHTKIDIATTLPQIVGRIRNSYTRNIVQLWYTKNKFYSYVTEEEYASHIKALLKKAGRIVDDFDRVSEETKESLLRDGASNPYLYIEGSTMRVNETVYYNEMHSFESINRTFYMVGGTALGPQKVNGVPHNYIMETLQEIKGLNKARLGKVCRFKDLCLEYESLIDAPTANKARILEIESISPLIKKGYEVLGRDKLASLEYVKKSIEKHLTLVDQLSSLHGKVINLLGYRVGEWVSLASCKADLDKVYKQLAIPKKAKATDLASYYDYKASNKRVDKILISGLAIMGPKL